MCSFVWSHSSLNLLMKVTVNISLLTHKCVCINRILLHPHKETRFLVKPHIRIANTASEVKKKKERKTEKDTKEKKK